VRVLVVEDDPGIGKLITEDLTDQGYAVDWARDGDEALSLLRSFPYDLVVLDIMLPSLDGFDITRTLRDERDHVPVLMLSARDAVADRIRGLQLGADDYLIKPFHLAELRARVQALLRRAQGEASNMVTVGRCQLDRLQRRAWFAGNELRLSATEYAILEYFVLHPDGYFNRDELLEHAWPGEASIDRRTVDTYIRYLRRKLADDAINTRRGLGYRFMG